MSVNAGKSLGCGRACPVALVAREVADDLDLAALLAAVVADLDEAQALRLAGISGDS